MGLTSRQINRKKQSHIDKAIQHYCKQDYLKSKEEFDLYLNYIIEEVDLDELAILNEVANFYVEIELRIAKINFSETNPIYLNLDKTKKDIKAKRAKNIKLTEYEENVHKLISYKTNYTIHWGNYSENKISNILKKEPKYLLWCIINLDYFAIDIGVFLLDCIRKEPSYFAALEINNAKQLIISKWETDSNDDDDYDNGSDDFNGGPDDHDYGPRSYGYDSWDEMNYDAFEGDFNAWHNYNQ